MSFLTSGRLSVVSFLLRSPTRRIQYPQLLLSLAKQVHLSSSRFQDLDSSDYVENSSTPTFFFQDHLASLPVPKLEDTCRRMLDAARPLTSESEWKEAERLVSEFVATDGKTLQKQFESHPPTYAEDLYLTDANLLQRAPSPLSAAYSILLYQHSNESGAKQITEAAKVVRSTLRFANALKAGKLRPKVWPVRPQMEAILNQLPFSPKPADFEGKRVLPLCMERHRCIFNTCRIPRIGKDALRMFNTSHHIVVLLKGHIYTFDVVSEDGRLASTSEIYHQLKYIADQSTAPAEHPVAVLTSEHRDTWAMLRQRLINKNAKAVETIETAMFVLCLDDDNPQTLNDQMNSFQCGTNRWYGKALQWAIKESGSAGMLAEEVFADGNPYTHLWQSVHFEAMLSSFTIDGKYGRSTISPVSLLKFDLDSELISAIDEAKQKFPQLKKSMPFHRMIYNGFSYHMLKSSKLSSDAMIQLAFQLAFYFVNGRLPSSFQPVNTAFYSGGRHSRSAAVTSETAAFVKAVTDGKCTDNNHLFQLLRASSDKNKIATLETMLGQSFVHHMKALEFLADQDGLNIPLFETAAYLKLFARDLAVYTTETMEDIAGASYSPSDKHDTTYVWYQIATKTNRVQMSSCHESAAELFSHVKKSLGIIMDIVQTRSALQQ